MSSKKKNTTVDVEMADSEDEKIVTMMDVLKEQQDFEDDANAVLGASDDRNCTYSKGYIKRQAIYACLTCCPGATSDVTKRAGVCLACSLACHENHELIELYTKRNFRCDCGNPKFNSHPCQFISKKADLNEENEYNQNFSGLYCVCHKPYPDPESSEEEEMIQCIICEDWLHASHLEATVPAIDQYSEMICKACMDKNDFLHDYSRMAVVAETDADMSMNDTNTSCHKDSSIINGEMKDKLLNGDSNVTIECDNQKIKDKSATLNIKSTEEVYLENKDNTNIIINTNKALEEETDITKSNEPSSMPSSSDIDIKENSDCAAGQNLKVEDQAEINEEKKSLDGIETTEVTNDKSTLETSNDKSETTTNADEIGLEPQSTLQSPNDSLSTEAATFDCVEKDKTTEDQSKFNVDEPNTSSAETIEVPEMVSQSKSNESLHEMSESAANKSDTLEVSGTVETTPPVDASGKLTESEMCIGTEESKDININEHKRKLSTEDKNSESLTKKQKTDKKCVRPEGVEKIFKGATFWTSNFRQKLCICYSCIEMYKDLSLLFLIDLDDTVTAYENLGMERNNGSPASQYEKGLQALSSLDRVQQINALTEYNKMRDKLLDFLKSFKDRKEIVKEEDIKAFFAGMKPKREPDGVYFCR